MLGSRELSPELYRWLDQSINFIDRTPNRCISRPNNIPDFHIFLAFGFVAPSSCRERRREHIQDGGIGGIGSLCNTATTSSPGPKSSGRFIVRSPTFLLVESAPRSIDHSLGCKLRTLLKTMAVNMINGDWREDFRPGGAGFAVLQYSC